MLGFGLHLVYIVYFTFVVVYLGSNKFLFTMNYSFGKSSFQYYVSLSQGWKNAGNASFNFNEQRFN